MEFGQPPTSKPDIKPAFHLNKAAQQTAAEESLVPKWPQIKKQHNFRDNTKAIRKHTSPAERAIGLASARECGVKAAEPCAAIYGRRQTWSYI